MKTKDLLNKLYEKYNMYFFVLKYKYHGDNEEIINMEISKLKQFGQVAVFDKINVEAEVRAKYFKDFIKQRI